MCALFFEGVLVEVLAFTFGLVRFNLHQISPADMVFRDSDGQTFAQLPEDTSPFRVQKEYDGATGATGDSWRCSVLQFVLSLISCHYSCWAQVHTVVFSCYLIVRVYDWLRAPLFPLLSSHTMPDCSFRHIVAQTICKTPLRTVLVSTPSQ